MLKRLRTKCIDNLKSDAYFWWRKKSHISVWRLWRNGEYFDRHKVFKTLMECKRKENRKVSKKIEIKIYTNRNATTSWTWEMAKYRCARKWCFAKNIRKSGSYCVIPSKLIYVLPPAYEFFALQYSARANKALYSYLRSLGANIASSISTSKCKRWSEFGLSES